MDYLHTRASTHTDDVLAAMTAKMIDCVLYLAAYRRRQYWRSRRVPWDSRDQKTNRAQVPSGHTRNSSKPAAPCYTTHVHASQHEVDVMTLTTGISGLSFPKLPGRWSLTIFSSYFPSCCVFSLSKLVSSGLGKRARRLCDQIDESYQICSEITF